MHLLHGFISVEHLNMIQKLLVKVYKWGSNNRKISNLLQRILTFDICYPSRIYTSELISLPISQYY